MTRPVGLRSGNARQAMASSRSAVICSGGIPLARGADAPARPGLERASRPSNRQGASRRLNRTARACAFSESKSLSRESPSASSARCRFFRAVSRSTLSLPAETVDRAAIASRRPSRPRTVPSTSRRGQPGDHRFASAPTASRSLPRRTDRPGQDRLARRGIARRSSPQRRCAEAYCFAAAPSPGTSGRSSPGPAARPR